MSSYNDFGYVGGQRAAERVAAMLRSLLQDATREFKTEAIDIIFKRREIDGVDIAPICSRWIKTILCSLDNDAEKQIKLMMIVWVKYQQGVNIDDDPLWHLIWMRIGLPLFSDKIMGFPAAGKAAPMGSLEKPEKVERRDAKSVHW